MAINIKFDATGNPEPPSIILATKNGNKLGLLNVNVDSIELKDKLKISEISFTLNKYVDGKLNNLWDKVVDFKLVWCKEWDCWFEIKVEIDEATETVKTVFGTQLGQAELSQIMVYNMEVNTEEDIARDDYKITILYDENDHEGSLLHRILKDKAPHYSIAYVDPTIARIQRQFSWDGSSICDVLEEVEEEIGCLVVYNSNSIEGGKPNRSISVYDLEQNCNDCGHRGEFTDKCPKCGSHNIKYGYGEDTTIFVTADELASDGIELVTDTDSVKNCFKLEAGDDLMTATIRNCNPNGSDYIWRFSNDTKEDMSDELVEKLESYDAEYKRYYNEYESNLDTTLLTQYNNLVGQYDDFYNTDSTCLNCDNKGKFYDKCPSCDSENLLTGKELQKISTPIVGYPSLMNAYYNTIDFALYLKSSLMPSIVMSDTTAEEQASLLTTSSLSPVAVNVKEANSISETTADSAVLSMAKIIVKSTYKVEVLSSSLSAEKKWSGTFKVTNYSDDTDTAEVIVNDIVVNNDAETFIKQKIEKALNKEDTDDYSISGLFEKEYNEFHTELTKYALKPLQSFYDAADTCISILTEQGAGDEANKPDLYEKLYLPYFQKQSAIAREISIRKNELAIIEGVYDETTKTTSGGLQNNIRNRQSVIQDALNFEDYLGEDLWKEFCSFRREDKYSNSNYISDGLNNAQLFERALEFFDVAENEIYKSSELQHSISTSLNNLLAIDKFKPLVKYFKNGNWIRVRVDDKIYKLRLLEYDIHFGSFESVPVEFSDVTKIKNSTTDVRDVIEQASSVASSYDAVTRQAKKGNVAKSTIEQWLDDGLNAANVQIQSNDSEEIIITKNGLLGRSYDDITGTYSPEQVKLTHNIMAYTDDNWQTVKQAIGKHNYSAYDEELGKIVDNKTGYGMSAEFVTAGVVSGSQIIGGDVYSDNYSITDRTGSYLNLRDGTFSFGGGALRFEGGELLISSPNVVTKNEVTTINEEYLKTTSVYAENLKVNAAYIQEKLTATQIDTKGLIAENISATTIEGKTIVGGTLLIGDKSTDTYAEIDANGKLTCTGADITGEINATSGTFTDGTFDNCTIKENCTIKGTLDGVDGTFSGDIEGATITGGTLLIGNEATGYSVWISDEDGILHAQGAIIDGDSTFTGTITAVDGTIGGWDITENGIDKNGIVGMSSNDNSYVSLVNEDTLSPIRFYAGNQNEMSEFTKTETLTFTSTGEELTQTISLSEQEQTMYKVVGAKCLTTTKLHSGGVFSQRVDITTGVFSESTYEGINLYRGTQRIYLPTCASKEELTMNSTNMNHSFTYLGNGVVVVSATSTKPNDSFSGLVTIEYGDCTETLDIQTVYDDTTVSVVFNPQTTGVEYNVDIEYTLSAKNLNFGVLEDGSLYASAAKISGTIYANEGEIDGLKIQNGGLEGFAADESNTFKLGSGGLEILGDTGRVQIGSICLKNENDYSVLSAQGEVRIQSDNISDGSSCYIRFGAFDSDGATQIAKITLHAKATGTWLSPKVTFYAKSDKVMPVSYSVSFYHNATSFGMQYPSTATKTTLMIPKGATESDDYNIVMNADVVNRWLRFSSDASGVATVGIAGSSTSSDYAELCMAAGGQVTSAEIEHSTFTWSSSKNNFYINGNILLDENKSGNLGSEDNFWDAIFATNIVGNVIDANELAASLAYTDSGTIDSSDMNLKQDIESLPDLYSQLFDSLEPVRYKYIDNTSDRYHTGFIAQDVLTSVEKAGLTTKDFAAYCEWQKEDGTITRGLRYSEFIALCVNEIQKLKKRVAELENKSLEK